LIRFGEEKMRHGKWAYIPVDVKNSKPLEGNANEKWAVSPLDAPWLENRERKDIGLGSPKPEHSLQLAHYWMMLIDLDYAPDIAPVGGIIDKDWNLTWRGLDDGEQSPLKIIEREWKKRWNAIVAMREDLDACTRPVYRPECRDCVWHDICEAELVRERHVSLLSGVTVTHVGKMEEGGITTTPQLAALDPRSAIAANKWGLTPSLGELFDVATEDPSIELSMLPKMSDKRLDKLEAIGINTTADLLSYDHATLAVPTYKLLADNIDAARVDMHAGKYPFYPRGQGAPVIPRADIEIDFDVENDDVVYLFGAYITRKQPDGSYDKGEYISFHFFNRDDPKEEGRQLAAFWAWLHQQFDEAAANGKTANVYCYSGKIAELPRMREASMRNADVPGVPTPEEINELGAAAHWVDLYEISKPLLWPTRRTGLKDVAKLAGFSWDASDAGGGNSIVWYQTACGLIPGDAAGMQQKLLTYNEDDVKATLALRNWLADGVAGNGWTLESVETLSN
jgi:predicted RecB family nuclease